VLAVEVLASVVVEVPAVRLAERTQAAEEVMDRLVALTAVPVRALTADMAAPPAATVRLAAVV
jgi:hypothetical protein